MAAPSLADALVEFINSVADSEVYKVPGKFFWASRDIKFKDEDGGEFAVYAKWVKDSHTLTLAAVPDEAFLGIDLMILHGNAVQLLVDPPCELCVTIECIVIKPCEKSKQLTEYGWCLNDKGNLQLSL
jgi:hypothetical protein